MSYAKFALIPLLAFPLCGMAGDLKMGVGLGLSSTSMDFDEWTFKDTANNSYTLSGDLNADEVREYVDSGSGLMFFARMDEWAFQVSSSSVTMEDDLGGSVGEWEWTKETFQATATYDFAKSGNHTFGVLFGIVNSSHELEIDAGGGFVAAVDADDEWTDAIIGFTHSMRFNKTLSWSSRIDVGSEGRAYFDTGLNWMVGDHFQVRPQISILTYDYDSGSAGDPDYYVYDATETSAGVGLAYLF